MASIKAPEEVIGATFIIVMAVLVAMIIAFFAFDSLPLVGAGAYETLALSTPSSPVIVGSIVLAVGVAIIVLINILF